MPGGHVEDAAPCTLQQTGSLNAGKTGGPAPTAYGPAAEHMGLVLGKGPPYAP